MPENETQKEILGAQVWMKKIQDQARPCGGLVTCTFSQSIEPVKSFLKLTPETKSGICQALVNRWIAAHANEGSLWNEVYTEVGGRPALRIDKMRGLLSEFAEGLTHSSGVKGNGIYQRMNSELYLMRNNVIPRMSMNTGHRIQDEGRSTATSTLTAGGALGIKIYDGLKGCAAYGRGSSAYVMISVFGPGVGHVMCLQTGSGTKGNELGEVTFFDPNFGEFYFGEGAAGFRRFLVYIFDTFYKKYSLFQLRAYGVSMN